MLRQPAVAGSFYPADAAILKQALSQFLTAPSTPPETAPPKALIAPHAGYIYSGAVAGRAYAQLIPFTKIIRRVVLLGPAHRLAFRGLALPEADRFATPLGEIALDREATDRLARLPQVAINGAAHAQEHALEVQLPFLQSVLPDFTLVPLLVGDAAAEQVAEALETVWGGPETLIVISSDLSHYLPYDAAETGGPRHGRKHFARSFADPLRPGLRRAADQRPAAGGAPARPDAEIAGQLQFRRHGGRPPESRRLRGHGVSGEP